MTLWRLIVKPSTTGRAVIIGTSNDADLPALHTLVTPLASDLGGHVLETDLRAVITQEEFEGIGKVLLVRFDDASKTRAFMQRMHEQLSGGPNVVNARRLRAAVDRELQARSPEAATPSLARPMP